MTGNVLFAWCFDHGRMHDFSRSGVWCTAWWVELNGSTEAVAMVDKTTRFGDARFIDELPFEQQVALAEAQP